MLRGRGAAETHSALQRDYVCFSSGLDPEGRVWLYDVESPHFTL